MTLIIKKNTAEYSNNNSGKPFARFEYNCQKVQTNISTRSEELLQLFTVL